MPPKEEKKGNKFNSKSSNPEEEPFDIAEHKVKISFRRRHIFSSLLGVFKLGEET